MATLILRLAAPLQAWGSSSKLNIRLTEREPTKSGVIGMIAAAMGIQRNDSEEKLKMLSKLNFGVRVHREGTLLRDFHTVHEKNETKFKGIPTKLEIKDTHLSYRDYLMDAVFVAGLETSDKKMLEDIVKAINNPVFPLFLGRRSCPPTLPIVIEISDLPLIEALKNAKINDNTSKDKDKMRLIYESKNEGKLIKDVPISFSQSYRKYGYRYTKEEFIPIEENDQTQEHDPMQEYSQTQEHDPMKEL